MTRSSIFLIVTQTESHRAGSDKEQALTYQQQSGLFEILQLKLIRWRSMLKLDVKRW